MKVHIGITKPTVVKSNEVYVTRHRDREYNLHLGYHDPQHGLTIKLYLDDLPVALTALPNGDDLYDYIINYWYPNMKEKTIRLLEKVTKLKWELSEQTV
jgi:hypothetical protein